MKRNYWDLFWAFIGVLIIINNAFSGKTTKEIFGFEINVWIYIGIWTIFSVYNFIRFFKSKEEEGS